MLLQWGQLVESTAAEKIANPCRFDTVCKGRTISFAKYYVAGWGISWRPKQGNPVYKSCTAIPTQEILARRVLNMFVENISARVMQNEIFTPFSLTANIPMTTDADHPIGFADGKTLLCCTDRNNNANFCAIAKKFCHGKPVKEFFQTRFYSFWRQCCLSAEWLLPSEVIISRRACQQDQNNQRERN